VVGRFALQRYRSHIWQAHAPIRAFVAYKKTAGVLSTPAVLNLRKRFRAEFENDPEN